MIIGSKIDEVRVDGNLSRFADDLKRLRQAGMQAVEVPPHGLDAIRAGRLDVKRAEEAARILHDSGMDPAAGVALSLHAPNPINLMDPADSMLHADVLRATLELAARLEASCVVVHAGRYIPEEAFAVGYERPSRAACCRMLEQEREWLLDVALEFPDQVLCVENVRPYRHHSPYCYAEDLESLGVQVRSLGLSNVRVTLDVGHAHMAAHYYGTDLLKGVRSVRDLIAHVHVHDNFGGVVGHHEKQQTHQIPFGRGDSHMPVGWGSVPLEAVLRELLPGYGGLFIMELRSRYWQHLEESARNLEDLIGRVEGALGRCREENEWTDQPHSMKNVVGG
ncbi:Sugar phosphate isomerase/epimerase [Desulfacinum hydrothermale DSM 13146]|uniref:Sugar phosphate isomerase/epimerase n=1 Tax=Desulfacinum hydrothermale DSM 13146 TaxID=1121390 RepID=A0A1W1XI04_9BACT|nr:sugar phosphate isomerase/epimerase [Desulfacinum hydrothermale]SMC23615.1 Sugar phosphate isomerase/epimerase [Desulfacinum hydrothermale DSM 13146]